MELEQPASQDSEVATATSETTTDDLSPDLLDQTTETEEEELEEELEGAKIRGTKAAIEKIKAERLMQADYTRKTQAVAEERKAIEAQREAVAREAQFHQANIQAVARITAINEQLQAFQNLDWNALTDSDPVQAQKLSHQMRALEHQRGQVSQHLSQVQQQQALAQQQSSAQLIEKAADYLRREVPNWSPQRDGQVRRYAEKIGIPAAAIPNVVMHMPQFGVALHKAELYDQLVAKHSAKPKPAAQDAPMPKLAAQKARAVKDMDKLSVDDWLKERNAQLKRNR